MPVLNNPKHERFAQGLAAGKSATEAYGAAGYKPHQPSASRLLSNVIVQSRVAELQARSADGVVLSRQYVLDRLMQNVERAMQYEEIKAGGEPTGEFKYEGSVANRALELLGKELGMFVDRSETTTTVRDISDQPLTEDEWSTQHATH